MAFPEAIKNIAANMAMRVPWELVLLRPRDKAKALEEFTATLPANSKMQGSSAAAGTSAEPDNTPPASSPALPGASPPPPVTTEETIRELKRRLAKELYRAELDLANRLRIAGKPCDCLANKHDLMIEAAAEELVSMEPSNTVYPEITDWLNRNRPKLTIQAISSGQYDDQYPLMAAEFRDFRKRIMGSKSLSAMIAPKQEVSESNPARVHFARGDIDSAIEAAKRLKSDRDLYVFATYLGYTIDNRPPPGMQAYVIVHSDGTTETIKPA